MLDPLRLTKDDCPLIVLSSHSYGMVSFLIKWWTSADVSHAMWLIDNGVVASQDAFFEVKRLETYMAHGGRLEFWRPRLSIKDRRELFRLIDADLKGPKIKTRYDWLGIMGQVLRWDDFNNPYTTFCSEKVMEHLLKLDIFKSLEDGTDIPKHPSPKKLKDFMKRFPMFFEFVGIWVSH